MNAIGAPGQAIACGKSQYLAVGLEHYDAKATHVIRLLGD
jgi:hypothetical protein